MNKDKMLWDKILRDINRTQLRQLSDDEQEILKKNLSSSEIYGLICSRGPLNEYKLKQIIAN